MFFAHRVPVVVSARISALVPGHPTDLIAKMYVQGMPAREVATGPAAALGGPPQPLVPPAAGSAVPEPLVPDLLAWENLDE